MIIGQFNDSLPPIMDGVSIVVTNYSYWINKNHASCFAIGPRISRWQDVMQQTVHFASFPIPTFHPYRLGTPIIDRKFNKTIDHIPFSLVHAHCPFVSGSYAYKLATARKIPLVATLHTKYRDDLTSIIKLTVGVNLFIKKIVRFYEKADSVWVPTEGLIEILREYGYWGAVEVVPNGSDIQTKSDKERVRLRAAGRQALHCAPEVPLLLYVGQHRWIKNIRTMIDALRILRDSGQHFMARLVGEGADTKEIKKTIQRFNLHNIVQCMGVVHDRQQLSSFYAASDLFLFPSLYDTDSLVKREAAAILVPTLFIKGAISALGITDGVNGYLAENSAPLLAAKIVSILSDPVGRRHCGQGAHDFLYRSWEEITVAVYKKYEEIIDRYKARQ